MVVDNWPPWGGPVCGTRRFTTPNPKALHDMNHLGYFRSTLSAIPLYMTNKPNLRSIDHQQIGKNLVTWCELILVLYIAMNGVI